MMSKGFFDAFNNYLFQFRESNRSSEFREFLIALAEWRITQIVLVMVREGITDFGRLTPRWLYYYSLDPSPKSKEIFERDRYDPESWEWEYYDSYQKLYRKYKQMILTFPKDERGIFYMHDSPPTSLFEYIYRYFFPKEPDRIIEVYEGKRVCKW